MPKFVKGQSGNPHGRPPKAAKIQAQIYLPDVATIDGYRHAVDNIVREAGIGLRDISEAAAMVALISSAIGVHREREKHDDALVAAHMAALSKLVDTVVSKPDTPPAHAHAVAQLIADSPLLKQGKLAG